jgi:hypothetical protein
MYIKYNQDVGKILKFRLMYKKMNQDIKQGKINQDIQRYREKRGINTKVIVLGYCI